MNQHAVRALFASALVTLVATAASAQTNDHLKCYKFRDVQTFDSAKADIETIEAAFPMQNCTIKKKAKLFCIPADKEITEITNGTDTPFVAQDLVNEQVCYKVSCPRVTIPDTGISDRFGSRTVGGFKASMLCVPGVVGPLPTTTTTSTTTTTTSTTTTTTLTTWSIRAGNTLAQIAAGVDLDSAGNVIAVGFFAGSIDFGLGAMMSAGSTDIFVVKLDPDGVAIWNQRYGDAGTQTAIDVAVDSTDRIVLTGYFDGAVDFGGGPLTTAGVNDAFLAKLDSDGSHLWSKRFGDVGSDQSFSVAIAANGDAVIAGPFGSTSIDFGGGAIAKVGTSDGFVARFNSLGTHVWSKGFGGAVSNTQAQAVAIDASGNILVVGSMAGSVDFGGGPLSSASGSQDIAAWKLSSAGSHVWSKIFGDSSSQSGTGIATDTADNVIITGQMNAGTDFGGGLLTSAGLTDVFLAGFNSAGVHQWSHIHGDASNQNAFGVETDSGDNVLATGNFTGSIDFGGGPFASLGSNDAYVAKFATDGSYISSQVFGDVGSQIAAGLTTNAAGSRYVVGGFNGTVDFGNGPLMSAGDFDAYIVKLLP